VESGKIVSTGIGPKDKKNARTEQKGPAALGRGDIGSSLVREIGESLNEASFWCSLGGKKVGNKGKERPVTKKLKSGRDSPIRRGYRR